MKNLIKPLIALAMVFGFANSALAWDGSRVKSMAHQLEQAMHHAHRQAEKEAHHGNGREQRALRALHQANQAATHFHRQVERNYSSAQHSRSDFRRLQSAMSRASWVGHSGHFSSHVIRDFYKAVDLMYDLEDAYYDYGHGGGHGGWNWGH